MSSSCLRRASYSAIACLSFDFLLLGLGQADAEVLQLALQVLDGLLGLRILRLVVGVALVGRVQVRLELGDVALGLLPLVLAVSASGEAREEDGARISDKQQSNSRLPLDHRMTSLGFV